MDENQKIDLQKQVIINLTAEVEELKVKNEELQTHNKELSEEIEMLRETKDESELRLIELRKDIADKIKTYTSLTMYLDGLKAEYTQSVKEYKEVVNSAKKEIRKIAKKNKLKIN
jgi:chromosome segregation ATPase